MSLDELLFRSEVVREKLVPGEMARLLQSIERRLEDAAHASIHPETRLEQAYHAILGCAMVGLRAHGLRAVDRPGHHIVALESLADTVGVWMASTTSRRCAISATRTSTPEAPTSATARRRRPSGRPASWRTTPDAGSSSARPAPSEHLPGFATHGAGWPSKRRCLCLKIGWMSRGAASAAIPTSDERVSKRQAASIASRPACGKLGRAIGLRRQRRARLASCVS
jgi:hypothetical protein